MSSDNGTNPNVDVTGQEVSGGQLEISAGENFVSFDALEKVQSESKKQARAEAKKAKEVEKAPVAPEEQKAQLDSEEQPQSSDKEEIQTQEEQKLAPTEDNSMIEVTVDGKKEQVSLKDLKSHYSGKVAWDKKFSELDRERKQFKSDKESVEGVIKEFYTNVSKDPKTAILGLCDIAGVDSVQFMRQLRESLLPEVQKLSQMTDVERKAYELEEENTALKRVQESEKARKQREQEETSLRAEVAKIQEAHGLDDEGVKSLYVELRDSLGKKPEEITPEMIGDFAQVKKSWEKVTTVLEKSRPELLSQDQVVSELTNFILDNPSMDENDINDVLEQIYGKRGSTKGLTKKVEAAAKAEGIPLNKQTKTITKDPASDPVSFSDLE